MHWPEATVRAPLVPIALLATFGVLFDRFATPSWLVFAGAALGGIVIWLVARRGQLMGLAIVAAGLAGLHHHLHRHVFPVNDVGFLVSEEPKLARLVGRVADEPAMDRPPQHDPLRSIPGMARTHFVIVVKSLFEHNREVEVSGQVAVTAVGAHSEIHAGQTVTLVGWLAQPHPPQNPGERDYASLCLDRRIRAVMTIRSDSGTIQITPSDQSIGWNQILAATRDWARQQLTASLPEPIDGTAAALLLGDGSAMSRADWEKFIRTGVVHVIAVSGQHLGVLAIFAWFVLRIFLVPRRWSAFIIALLICYYSALAGGRPPVLRSAIMVTIVCGGIVLARSPRPANTFALSWLAVLLVNPADLLDPGCQFSFLCVAVLVWGCHRWFESKPIDPMQRLIEDSRFWPERIVRRTINAILISYAVTLALGLAILPLTGAHYHLISLAGLLIGPIAIAIASVALIAGFMQLLLALVSANLANFVAFITHAALKLLNMLVDWADQLPGSHFYVGTIPGWWLVGFYLLLAAMLWWPAVIRRPVWTSLVMLSWACLGLGVTLYRPNPDGMVMTFLAVGHGGCTVIETPDGRVLVYDAGAMTGPEVTHRIIAPYLWHRNIARIDEVFLSHADLDHFNGLPALMERFPIGRVTLTPTFSDKPTPGVHEVIESLRQHGVPVRRVVAGESFSAGDVALEVLHPPVEGPVGPENNRSMVLGVRHRGRTFLLTGDLDNEGRSEVLRRKRELVDVMMAPHHGGKSANPPDLVQWCRPEVVVACNGANDRIDVVKQMYQQAGCKFLGTWPNGAVTFTSRDDGLWVETYRSGHHFRLVTPNFAPDG